MRTLYRKANSLLWQAACNRQHVQGIDTVAISHVWAASTLGSKFQVDGSSLWEAWCLWLLKNGSCGWTWNAWWTRMNRWTTFCVPEKQLEVTEICLPAYSHHAGRWVQCSSYLRNSLWQETPFTMQPSVVDNKHLKNRPNYKVFYLITDHLFHVITFHRGITGGATVFHACKLTPPPPPPPNTWPDPFH